MDILLSQFRTNNPIGWPLSRESDAMYPKRLAARFGVFLICLPIWAQEVGANVPIQEALVKSLNSAGRKLIALAEATPAEDFSWAPSDEVRSISQVYMHVVGNNFQIPAVLGAEPPEGIDVPDRPYDRRMQKVGWEEEIAEKEAVIGLLKKSLDYAATSIPEIGDLDEVVTPLGSGTRSSTICCFWSTMRTSISGNRSPTPEEPVWCRHGASDLSARWLNRSRSSRATVPVRKWCQSIAMAIFKPAWSRQISIGSV